MPKKKKKKNIQARQQRKQQRRKALVKKSKQGDPAVYRKDPFSSFQASGSTLFSPENEQFLMSALDSSDMIDAPEFDEIIIAPLDCVQTFLQNSQELGRVSDAPEKLTREEMAEHQASLLEKTTAQLLNEELRKKIIDALGALQQRLKKSGKQREVLRVAIVQSFLEMEEIADAWPMIGLVQAIVRRSAAIGNDLLDTSQEVFASSDADALFLQKPSADAARKGEALLEKYPGLQEYMNQQTEQIWEESLQAIMKGDLCLGIYSLDELKKTGEIMKNVFGHELLEKAIQNNTLLPQASPEQGKAFVSQLDAYLTELMTPERLDQLRARLKEILKDTAYKKWWAVIFLILEDMGRDNAVENGKAFLLRAYLGELAAIDKAIPERQADDREI